MAVIDRDFAHIITTTVNIYTCFFLLEEFILKEDELQKGTLR